MVCFIVDLECSTLSMAHRFALPPPRTSRQRRSGLLRARCRRFPPRPLAVEAKSHVESYEQQDTSDRLLPPNLPIYLHPRSWLSSCLSPTVV
jgi:hypothetical protein